MPIRSVIFPADARAISPNRNLDTPVDGGGEGNRTPVLKALLLALLQRFVGDREPQSLPTRQQTILLSSNRHKLCEWMICCLVGAGIQPARSEFRVLRRHSIGLPD